MPNKIDDFYIQEYASANGKPFLVGSLSEGDNPSAADLRKRDVFEPKNWTGAGWAVAEGDAPRLDAAQEIRDDVKITQYCLEIAPSGVYYAYRLWFTNSQAIGTFWFEDMDGDTYKVGTFWPREHVLYYNSRFPTIDRVGSVFPFG